MTYTLLDFDAIRNQGFDYTIPKESYALIQKLAKTVGDSGYSPTPVFPKKDKPKPLREPFKATKRIESKGNDKRIQELTSMLNKVTHDTVSTVTTQMIVKIHEIEEECNEYMPKVYTVLFEMMLSNRFYIQSYVTMFIHIMHEWPLLKDELDKRILKHKEDMFQVEVCDTTEYDRFCRLKSLHEYQRTTTQFILYLTLQDRLDTSILKQFYAEIKQYIQEGIQQSSQKGRVEEWVEHMYILTTLGNSILSVLKPELESMTTLSMKEYPGMSNKSMFRYMDMVENIFV